jgi:hypothetical protein
VPPLTLANICLLCMGPSASLAPASVFASPPSGASALSALPVLSLPSCRRGDGVFCGLMSRVSGCCRLARKVWFFSCSSAIRLSRRVHSSLSVFWYSFVLVWHALDPGAVSLVLTQRSSAISSVMGRVGGCTDHRASIVSHSTGPEVVV